jgi:hypothetical protein
LFVGMAPLRFFSTACRQMDLHYNIIILTGSCVHTQTDKKLCTLTPCIPSRIHNCSYALSVCVGAAH